MCGLDAQNRLEEGVAALADLMGEMVPLMRRIQMRCEALAELATEQAEQRARYLLCTECQTVQPAAPIVPLVGEGEQN